MSNRAHTTLVGPNGVVADRLDWATTFFSRLRGLRGRATLSPGEGLLLEPCSQVHTFGVPYAIDAVFCDTDLNVMAVQTLHPRRVSHYVHHARCCIELPGGHANACGVGPGVRLELR